MIRRMQGGFRGPDRALPGPGRVLFSDAGFTLIELMIVVAIIGILASIAIPNYLSFQCRSKQAEAKSGLGALFTSQKAFLGEHNTYGTDLVTINWTPEGSPMYIYGFQSTQYPSFEVINNWDSARNHTAQAGVVAAGGYSTGKMKRLSGVPLEQDDLSSITDCTGQSFVLGAAADIGPDTVGRLDQWIIRENREMQAVINDCLGG